MSVGDEQTGVRWRGRCGSSGEGNVGFTVCLAGEHVHRCFDVTKHAAWGRPAVFSLKPLRINL